MNSLRCYEYRKDIDPPCENEPDKYDQSICNETRDDAPSG